MSGRLSEALREATEQVAAYDVLDTAVARGRRRRRRTAALAAGAAVGAAAIVAAPVLLLRPQPPVPQASPPSTAPASSAPAAPAGATVDPHAADRPDFFFTVAAGPAAGFEIQPTSITADFQIAAVLPAAGGEPVASLTLYRTGADTHGIPWTDPFQPQPFADPNAEPNARVNDSPAFVAVTEQWSAVLWRYAPDAIASVRSTGAAILPEQDLIEIAQAVRFVDPYPAPVPFRLGYLPDHLAPLYGVGTDLAVPAASAQFLGFDDDGSAMDIKISTDPDSFREINPEYQDWDWRPTTIAGRAGRCVDLIDGRRCEVPYGDVIVGIGSGSLTAAEFEQIFGGVQLADLSDPTTWYDIDDAIPGT